MVFIKNSVYILFKHFTRSYICLASRLTTLLFNSKLLITLLHTSSLPLNRSKSKPRSFVNKNSVKISHIMAV